MDSPLHPRYPVSPPCSPPPAISILWNGDPQTPRALGLTSLPRRGPGCVLPLPAHLPSHLTCLFSPLLWYETLLAHRTYRVVTESSDKASFPAPLFQVILPWLYTRPLLRIGWWESRGKGRSGYLSRGQHPGKVYPFLLCYLHMSFILEVGAF